MPQAGIDPMVQSHDSYEARALPPSHHGWIHHGFKNFQKSDCFSNAQSS